MQKSLMLSRRKPLSYRNQSINLLRKSLDWFLYHNGLRLERVRRSKKLKSFLIQKNIKWNFILKKATWWGRSYERLIGIVKYPLKEALQKSLLTYEELYTVITEIESVMNSRPLTYLSKEKYQESLKPNHAI